MLAQQVLYALNNFLSCSWDFAEDTSVSCAICFGFVGSFACFVLLYLRIRFAFYLLVDDKLQERKDSVSAEH